MLLFAVFALIASAYAQTKGTMTPNELLTLPSTFNGVQANTKITLDANWRWSRNIKDNPNGYSNCYTSSWDPNPCPDPISCSKNCALEGVSQSQWLGTYGVSTSGNAVTLRYVTNGPYGVNVGSRLYLMDEAGVNYKRFDLLGKQFVMTVDVSKLPCALNGAVYFVEIPFDGGLNSLNTAGAPYGTGYGDAQCPKDIKYIQGYTNINGTGACANEMDIWEANSYANAFTPHPCSVVGTYGCASSATCGDDANRYTGVCDKDGGDYNNYRSGNKLLYGPGSTYAVDTTKPFDLITQFITSTSGDLVKIQRYYRQNGKLVDGGFLTDDTIAARKLQYGETNSFAARGGLKAMGQSLKRGHVLVMSVWDDSSSTQMRWLDSIYPVGSTAPGSLRGPCPATDQRDISYLRSTYASASVTYSNLRVEPISTTPSPTPTPPSPSPVPTPPSPSPAPSPVPSPIPGGYWKCKACKLVG